ncbi:hypothetical protein E2C01_066586 [Portunus trituberculatus]|uniref:Uncharacterized protein n=1 Tax=Portunus trituberculatus TaxID=210409 RepID=A0A5B7HSQ6_PORTR|nr:hypothetical protein [Portunus trituberculatus]
MPRHHGLSEARLQQLLAEKTIGVIGDITFMEIYEIATDEPDAESHTSPPPPPYVNHDSASPPSTCHPLSEDACGTDIVIDVVHSTMKTCDSSEIPATA